MWVSLAFLVSLGGLCVKAAVLHQPAGGEVWLSCLDEGVPFFLLHLQREVCTRWLGVGWVCDLPLP